MIIIEVNNSKQNLIFLIKLTILQYADRRIDKFFELLLLLIS